MGMIAYNITNHGWVDEVVRQAKAKDVGVVAMKAARSVWPGRNREASAQRVQKIQAAIPGEMKIPMPSIEPATMPGRKRCSRRWCGSTRRWSWNT